MDIVAIQRQLNDLPATFRRPGAPYTQLIDALAAGLALYCGSSDGLLNQCELPTATDGWIDVWGAIVAVMRRTMEANQVYKARVGNSVVAPSQSPVAIKLWLAAIELLQSVVTENLPSVGYSILLPANQSAQRLQQVIKNLGNVRPAGVPFQVYMSTAATILDTVNYLDAPRVTGAYLESGKILVPLNLGPATNNATSNLPDLLFSDPFINPTAS